MVVPKTKEPTPMSSLTHLSGGLQVYVFNIKDSQMDMKWVGVGSDMGSGYGSAVSTGDVTGDGWSELFVGAPFFALKTSAKGSQKSNIQFSAFSCNFNVELIFKTEDYLQEIL